MSFIKGKYNVSTENGYEQVFLETIADSVVETHEKTFVSTYERDKWNSKSDNNHNHDDIYLKLSGGTMTGRLNINNNTIAPLCDNFDGFATATNIGSGIAIMDTSEGAVNGWARSYSTILHVASKDSVNRAFQFCVDNSANISIRASHSNNTSSNKFTNWYNLFHTGNKPNWSDIEQKPSFAQVATTGSFNDLLDKPTIVCINDDSTQSTNCTWSSKKINSMLNTKADIDHGFHITRSDWEAVLSRLTELEAGVSRPMTSITITNKVTELPLGGSYTIKTTFQPPNATETELAFDSSDKQVATVSDTGIIQVVGSGTTTITVSARNKPTVKDSMTILVKQPVTSVSIANKKETLDVGAKHTLTVNVLPSNASNKNVIVESSHPNIVSIENTTLTGVAVGTATITVKSVSNPEISDSFIITVTQKVTQIKITSKPTTLNVGDNFTVVAQALPENAYNKTLNFISSSDDIATIDKTTGVMVAKGPGNVTITVKATDGSGIQSSFVVNVIQIVTNITIDNPISQLYVGDTHRITYNVLPANASDKTVWLYSDNDAIASIDETGLITAKQPGIAYINVKSASNNNVTAWFKLEVLPIIQVDPTKITITNKTSKVTIGEPYKVEFITEPANASKTVIYSTSNPTIASIDTEGNLIGKSNGNVTVTVSYAHNRTIYDSFTVYVEGTFSMTIGNRIARINIGEYHTLSFTVYPESYASSISFYSTNTDIIECSTSGTIRGKKVGTATIVAKSSTNAVISDSITIACVDPSSSTEGIVISNRISALKVGASQKLYAEGINTTKSIVYKSDNSNIASVDNLGTVSAKTEGQTTIHSSLSGNESVTDSVDLVAYTIQEGVSEIIIGEYAGGEITVYSSQQFRISYICSTNINSTSVSLFIHSCTTGEVIATGYVDKYTGQIVIRETYMYTSTHLVRVNVQKFINGSSTTIAQSAPFILNIVNSSVATATREEVNGYSNAIEQQYSQSHEGDVIDIDSPEIINQTPNSNQIHVQQWISISSQNVDTNVGVRISGIKTWAYDTQQDRWIVVSDCDFNKFAYETAKACQPDIRVADDKSYIEIKHSNERTIPLEYNLGRLECLATQPSIWNNGKPYVVASAKFNLIKWDETDGDSNLEEAEILLNTGVDWVAGCETEIESHDPIAIGKYLLANEGSRVSYMTNLPKDWEHGLPERYLDARCNKIIEKSFEEIDNINK